MQPPLGERVQAWSVLHGIVDPASGAQAMTVDEIRAAERMVPANITTPAESDAERLTGGTV